ncbi:MAG TPA: hypothetical protein VMP00_06345 [Burkholderiales bacterium]|nr:hypothetical protein [Burkholderiales bacterium]
MFYDASTGYSVPPDPVFASPAGNSPIVFAGLAYEIHAQLPGGGTIPVNPATHEFRSGERFIVHYRPTLPGLVEVYNINPAGQQSQIDRVEVAAAQHATLGPYEFTATKGQDQLRLVLTPCSSPQLLATTRDIVRVESAAPGNGLNLAACAPLTRSATARPVTRDIRKVAVEDNTGFALDQVSAQEFSSGQLAPRELTIVFRHR